MRFCTKRLELIYLITLLLYIPCTRLGLAIGSESTAVGEATLILMHLQVSVSFVWTLALASIRGGLYCIYCCSPTCPNLFGQGFSLKAIFIVHTYILRYTLGVYNTLVKVSTHFCVYLARSNLRGGTRYIKHKASVYIH